MEPIGRALILMGVVLALFGALFLFGGRIGFGRLPGDIVVEGKRGAFYFPIVSGLLLSVLLTLLLWIATWFRGRG